MAQVDKNIDSAQMIELLKNKKAGNVAGQPSDKAKLQTGSLFANKAAFGKLTNNKATGLEAGLQTTAPKESVATQNTQEVQAPDKGSVWGTGTSQSTNVDGSIWTAQSPVARSTDDILGDNAWDDIGASFSGNNNNQEIDKGLQNNEQSGLMAKVKGLFSQTFGATKKDDVNNNQQPQQKESLSQKTQNATKEAEKMTRSMKQSSLQDEIYLGSAKNDLNSSKSDSSNTMTSAKSKGGDKPKNDTNNKANSLLNKSKSSNVMNNANNGTSKGITGGAAAGVLSGSQGGAKSIDTSSISSGNINTNSSTKDVSSIGAEAQSLDSGKQGNTQTTFAKLENAQETSQNNQTKAAENNNSTKEAEGRISANAGKVSILNTQANQAGQQASAFQAKSTELKNQGLTSQKSADKNKTAATQDANTAKELGQASANAFAGAATSKTMEATWNATANSELGKKTANFAKSITSDASSKAASGAAKVGHTDAKANEVQSQITDRIADAELSNPYTAEAGALHKTQAAVLKTRSIQEESAAKVKDAEAAKLKTQSETEKAEGEKNGENAKSAQNSAKEFGKDVAKQTAIGTATSTGQKLMTSKSKQESQAATTQSKLSKQQLAQADAYLQQYSSSLQRQMGLQAKAGAIANSTNNDRAKIVRNNQENEKIAQNSAQVEEQVVQQSEELLAALKNKEKGKDNTNFNLDKNDTKDNNVNEGSQKGAAHGATNGKTQSGTNGLGKLGLNKNDKSKNDMKAKDDKKLKEDKKDDKEVKDENKENENVKEENTQTSDVQENPQNDNPSQSIEVSEGGHLGGAKAEIPQEPTVDTNVSEGPVIKKIQGV